MEVSTNWPVWITLDVASCQCAHFGKQFERSGHDGASLRLAHEVQTLDGRAGGVMSLGSEWGERMSILKEVADGIELIADGIDNIRKIYDAVHEGKEYLETKHPDVKSDVAAMCVEMRKTLQAIAAASSIVTHFRFNVSDGVMETEPTRFNEHFIQYKMQAQAVESQLDSLRGHCGVVTRHAEKLDKKAKNAGLTGMLALFGLSSPQREQDLAEGLRKIGDDDLQFLSYMRIMRIILEGSLNDIGSRLGPPGSMDARNVPAAAEVLGEYATRFGKLESDANFAALQLQGLIDELSR